MRVFIKTIAAIMLAHVVLVTTVAAQETYNNPAFGFTATKPKGWHFTTAEQYHSNLSRVEGEKIKELISRYNKVPFFSVTKYNQDTYTDLNPSVQVRVREAGNAKGVQLLSIMKLTAGVVLQTYKDAVIVEGPAETTISGVKGAYMRVNFTFEIAGMKLPATSELWMVPHKELFFTIAASTRQDEKNAKRSEVRQVIDSIKLD